MRGLARFIPAVAWLRCYERSFVIRDLAGGVAVGAMLIPQGLAFAQIVKVPAAAALLALMVGVVLGIAASFRLGAIADFSVPPAAGLWGAASPNGWP